MITQLSDISEQAMSLPSNERAYLARELIRSLGIDGIGDVEQAWLVELDKREQGIKNGETTERLAFDVLDEIRDKLSLQYLV